MSDSDNDIRVLRAQHYDEYVMTLTPPNPAPASEPEPETTTNQPVQTIKTDSHADAIARFLNVVNRPKKKPTELEDEPLIDPLALLLKRRPAATDEDEQEYDDDEES